jgi:hypothetical protein
MSTRFWSSSFIDVPPKWQMVEQLLLIARLPLSPRYSAIHPNTIVFWR